MAKSKKTGIELPVCSFSTFKTFCTALNETAVPPVIDRSVMPKMSGVSQSQIESALRFLGLTDSNGLTKPILKSLVESLNKPEEWSSQLQGIITESYLDIVDPVDVDTASGKALRDAFKAASHLDGAMLGKSLRFYLKALDDAGISYSPHFKDATKGLTASPKKNNKIGKNNGSNKKPDGEELADDGKSEEKEITPVGMIDFAVPFGTKDGLIRVPRDIAQNQIPIFKAIVSAVEALAKQNDGGT